RGRERPSRSPGRAAGRRASGSSASRETSSLESGGAGLEGGPQRARWTETSRREDAVRANGSGKGQRCRPLTVLVSLRLDGRVLLTINETMRPFAFLSLLGCGLVIVGACATSTDEPVSGATGGAGPAAGGASSGGSATGGFTTGGSATGGAATGGAATGGSGASTGGVTSCICEVGESAECASVDAEAFVGGTAVCNEACTGWNTTECLVCTPEVDAKDCTAI